MATKIKAPSQYDTHAAETLEKMGIEFRPAFLFHGPFWPDDKETRNVWELILTRKGKNFSSRFVQSIADSFLYPAKDSALLVPYNHSRRDRSRYGESNKVQTQRNKPSAYDLLACLTKQDPGTFGDFCGDFGYDTDSRKAEKTYFAVQEEWEKVRSFFSREELEIIREIA